MRQNPPGSVNEELETIFKVQLPSTLEQQRQRNVREINPTIFNELLGDSYGAPSYGNREIAFVRRQKQENLKKKN